MTVLTHESLSMSEICQILSRYSTRTIMRYIKPLVKSGKIQHGRIKKRGKRKRYFIAYEKTKNNLLIRIVDYKNKNNWKVYKKPVTQRNLSQLISQEIQLYRKMEKEIWKQSVKEKNPSHYVHYHVALFTKCLRWISQITWAIQSGMLGNSQSNLDLAQRNKERYEEFLEKLVYNLYSKNYKVMNVVSTAIYYEIMDSLSYNTMTSGTQKGKYFLQLDKKNKFEIKL